MLRKRHRFADTADAFYALMLLRLYCWCSDAADALMLLMGWCWGCAAAADALMHCTDELMMLMCWCCWYDVAADVPMLMCQFSCTGANALREAILQKIPFFYEILSQTGRGGQPDFISLIQKLLCLSNHPSFHSPFHSSKDRFHHILWVKCTNIEFWVALVMIYAVLSNFDFVAKFTVKNLNKDFINAGRGAQW